MNDEKPLRIGIIGAGQNTQTKHIPKLQEIDGVEIVSVCNRSRESSRLVAERFNIPKVTDNWQDLIAAQDTDAIVIGTWPYLHCPAALSALNANKHVLVEARMAMNAGEARQMLRSAQANPHLVTQIVPSPFSFGVDAAIQRLISEGYLGHILAIEVRDFSGDFIDAEAPLHWRQNSDLGGVNIMGLGIWYETLMRWVGEAERVMAMGKVCVKMRRGESGRLTAVSIPEHLTVIAGMACGAQATFSISQAAGLESEKSATLYGSEGTIRFAGDRLFGGRRGDNALSEIPIPNDEKGSWRVEEEFVNAIRGLESVKLTTFQTGVKYMAFTEAVMRSVKNGQMMAVSRI
jgi:predicted dehydrogenase